VANRAAAKTADHAKTVAVGCGRLPIAAHGKEGVSGSSPEEGSAKDRESDLATADRDLPDRALPVTLAALSLRGLRDRLDELTGLLVLAEGDVGLGDDADEPAVLDNG
jgi:hypothetical protein